MTKSRQALLEAHGRAVQAYQRSIDAFDDAVAAQLGVNRTDLRCLDWLWDGPRSTGELGAATGLSSAATTTLLDRLEDKGFLRRVRDETDRRKIAVEMTELGRRRAGEMYGPLAADGEHLLASYSEAELATIRSYLERSRELADRHRLRVSDPRTRRPGARDR